MLTWIRHNQGIVVGIIISVALVVWTFGCENKVMSPISGQKVSRAQLHIEVSAQSKALENQLDTLKEQALLQYTMLDKADMIRDKIFEFAALTTEQNTFNPTGLITLVGTLLGIGVGIDNRIKDKVIKNRPLPPTNTT